MVDNLFNLLIELMSGNTLTADYLATKLGVSKRTIYRYCDILSISNIPLILKVGASGGIKIGEEYLINNLIFKENELNLIKLSLATSKEKELANTILAKLLALKKSNTSSTINLENVVNIHQTILGNNLDKKIQVLDHAIDKKLIMDISYHGRNGDITTRSIAPLNFIINEGEWYIYCYCYLREEYRTFKLSRISNFSTQDTYHTIPSNYPKEWIFNEENKINLVLKVNPKTKYMIEEWLGLDMVKSDENGYFVNTVINYHKDVLYKLLSFGDGIEIISPLDIRNELIDIVKNITQNYSAR